MTRRAPERPFATLLLRTALVLACLTRASAGAAEEPARDPGRDIATPRVLDDRFVLELFAREPDIVTPVAIDADERGRVWAIESNTHFPRPDYAGHETDRVLVLEDLDRDGRADRFTVFADGLHQSMGLAWRDEGRILLATRRAVLALEDRNGDGRADRRRVLARLETRETYPHNGLTGFAFDALGDVYFAIGENLGVAYRLVGSDGSVLEGGTEGGNVFRMRPDGSGLERFATGFWNTFHLAFDAFGHLFAVDNDPDSRPPCRLLHIVEGGDYGYRRWLGRKGLHPFTAWNGGLPGTLPMVSGTGEAPSGIVAYEHTAFPREHHGALFVTSWGDHRLEVYFPRRRGASFDARGRAVVEGGEWFRPVGLALAPDGSLYVSDWVDRDYHVHRKGRIWRLRDRRAASGVEGRTSLPVSPPFGDDLGAGVRELFSHPVRAVRERAVRDLLAFSGGAHAARGLFEEGADPRALYHATIHLALRGKLEAMDVRRLEEVGAAPSVLSSAVRLLRRAGRDSEDLSVEELIRDLVRRGTPPVKAEALLALRAPGGLDVLGIAAETRDPFVLSAALTAAARLVATGDLLEATASDDPRVRLSALLALRRLSGLGRGFVPFGDRRIEVPLPAVERLLGDDDLDLRRAAIQWVGEEGLRSLRDRLEDIVPGGPLRPDIIDAYLAARSLLDGESPEDRDREERDRFLFALAADRDRPSDLRRLSLRAISGDLPDVSPESVRALLHEDDPELHLELVRTLRLSSEPWVEEVLALLARDPRSAGDSGTPCSRRVAIRREAIAGLSLYHESRRDLLVELLRDPAAAVRREAARALRGVELGPAAEALRESAETAGLDALDVPAREGPAWRAGLLEGGDPREGELVFRHPKGPRCSSCHVVDGRGGAAGPDLSRIGDTPRAKLLESILEPSREVAPQFPTSIVMTGEGPLAGILLGEDAAGRWLLADAQGRVLRLEPSEVLSVERQEGSLMPDGLEDLMTYRELRDLLAFLASRKPGAP